MATETITVGPPREGLIDLQILDALRRMGLNAVPFTPKSHFEAQEYIYTCVESNLPVIAGVPNHVVVVIGHDYKAKIPDVDSWQHMSEIVEHFIVHDDASGAYLKKLLGKLEEKSEVMGGVTTFLTLGEDKVDFCIVAMPERVNLTWEDVKQHTVAWLKNINNFVVSRFDMPTARPWNLDDTNDLVFRTYLRKSRDFKRDVIRGKMTRNDEIAAKYRCTQMPKYVWVVELARRQQIIGKKPNERKICGELVFDATANRHVVDESLIAFHLDGMLYIQGLNGTEHEIIETDEAPYDPLLRRQVNC